MKYILAIGFLLMANAASAGSVNVVVGQPIAAGGSCSATPFLSVTTADTQQPVGDAAGREYVGLAGTVNATSICRVDVYVYGKAGTTKSYQVEVHTTDGETDAFISLIGTSGTIAVGSLTTSAFNTFAFSTPVTGITANTTVLSIAVVPTDHTASGTEYLTLMLDSGLTGASPAYARWTAAGALGNYDDSYQTNFKLYALQ